MRIQHLAASLLLVSSCVAIDPESTSEPTESEQPQALTTGTPTVQAVSTEVTIPSGVVTVLPLAGESWDVGSMHSITANTSRLNAPADGIYHVSATISWRANSNGSQRYVTVRRNGILHDVALAQIPPVKSATDFTTVVVSADIKLAGKDYVEVSVQQDSGSSVNVVVGSHVELTWVAAGI
ncbi:MAG TPA: hypothetical protein VGO00_06010 [Kofleriaceae bacterium]|nr:hypothetical protein [Kofleriaceae bacterium]